MIIHPAEMRKEVKEKMRGGEGSVHLQHLVEANRMTNARLLARLTIAPGSGIGEHEHLTETEYYIIEKGRGTVNDNGVDKEIGPGDVIVTGGGEAHSIRNTGTEDLEFLAVIVTY
jgi:mannose-6-phosphate isomerase-like protein (cupin superfamily)